MDSFQQPAFSLSSPPDNFDPTHVPTDGEQYLHSVIYERNKCPAVVVRPLKRDVGKETATTNDSKSCRSVWDELVEVNSFSLVLFDLLIIDLKTKYKFALAKLLI